MKTKKYVIALAIFSGTIINLQAKNLIDLNGQQTTSIEKSRIKVPGQGN